MLEIKNIYKSYNGKEVLQNFCFDLNDNEKLGIVGQNGSGKSTMVNIIGGIINPDKGTVTVNGYSLKDKEYKSLIGCVFELPVYIEELTINESLLLMKHIYGISTKTYQKNILFLNRHSFWINTLIPKLGGYQKVIRQGFH